MKIYSVTKASEEPVIYNEIPSDNGLYYAFEYDKSEEYKPLKLGIKCEKATKMIVKHGDVTIHLKKALNNIWHQPEIDKAFDKTEGVFGVNIGGDFYIQALERDKVIDKAHVAIIPKVFSLEEYRIMQREVEQLIEVFSANPTDFKNNHYIYLKRLQQRLYKMEDISQLIEEFTHILDEIIENPAFTLTEERIKKHHQNIKKWTPKLIVQQSIMQSDYLITTQKVQSFDIIEHQIIAEMIAQLQIRIDKEMYKEYQMLSELKQADESLNNTMNKQSNNLFNVLKTDLQKEINILKNRQRAYQKITRKLNIYAKVPLFSREKLPVKETHLFKTDVKYHMIFHLYRAFQTLYKNISSQLTPFMKSILKSPSLYEIWILFKIVDQLKHWGFDSAQFIEWIHLKYSTAEKLQGFDEIFELSKMPFRVKLMFNKPCTENLRPDYVLGIQNIKNGIWQWHTLDAKYKVYSNTTYQYLKEDLQHSALRYKNRIYIEKESITSSTLIHPTNGVFHWNIHLDDAQPQTIGHFFVKPADANMLKIYFKRLLHHFNGCENICPNCHEKVIGKEKWSGIFTYVCDKCSEVWVSSHCWSCGKHTGNLYKYAIDNYHYQEKQKWSVHCSKCGSSADKDKKFKQKDDLLHESYEEITPFTITPNLSVNRFVTPGIYKPKTIIPSSKLVQDKSEKCRKCNGTGYISIYNHIESGVCFDCKGTGEIINRRTKFSNTYHNIDDDFLF